MTKDEKEIEQLYEKYGKYALMNGSKYDKDQFNVSTGCPVHEGIYMVALDKFEGGAMPVVFIGSNEKLLYLSLAYWNGKDFVINGVKYQFMNVKSWLYICDMQQGVKFFNEKNYDGVINDFS